jgi:pimeloyl-ACP methyl ester carboxylesterase
MPPRGSVHSSHHHHHHYRRRHHLPSWLWSAKWDSPSAEEAHSRVSHETLRERLQQRSRSAATNSAVIHATPHPHWVADGHVITRFLGVLLPLSLQHACRDHGWFRTLADTSVTVTAPLLALAHPSLVARFLHWSNNCQRLRYGGHFRQTVDVWIPAHCYASASRPRRILFFVHGGAWGSGEPWMYRLLAHHWLISPHSTTSTDNSVDTMVAMVRYRTYPDGCIREQVEDCHRAMDTVWRYIRATLYSHVQSSSPVSHTSNHNELPHITVMGHSSGAHVALLWLLQHGAGDIPHTTSKSTNRESILPTTADWYSKVDSFVGLSGVYDIDHHFDYEASRGVEELSPLKPVCGGTRAHLVEHSPHCYLPHTLSQHPEDGITCLPAFACLLLHGMDDATVPFPSTAEAARGLRACGMQHVHEVYLPNIDHTDPVMHLILGGPTLTVVQEFVREMDQSYLTKRNKDNERDDFACNANESRRGRIHAHTNSTRILAHSKL